MKKMFWIDLEMTGLDEKVDHILEVAVKITNLDFEILDSYHAIVFQPAAVVENMNDWCKKTHGKSGLTALIPSGKKIEAVERELIDLVSRHYGKDEKVVLCGNSVGNDKRFIDAHLKIFAKLLHYRLVDVSSFKEIFRSKYKVEVKKSDGHRADQDIIESIEELKAYLGYVKV